MKYNDRVYGEVEITEPVILDLMASPALQRLKDIDQAGYKALWVKPDTTMGEYDHSRFAHSVGVYLLLRKFNASLEEQIAGLIHDVSHSAFSHCIDYVLDAGSQKEQNYQDNIFDTFVRASEIPDILEKYNVNLDYVLDDANFPLKETSLPDLCADRIDYSLRTSTLFGEIEDGNYFIDNLSAEGGRWVFKNVESARKYAELFRTINTDYYSAIFSAVMFRTVGDYLRYALSKSYISEADLYTTDTAVLQKIGLHLEQDSHLQLLFDRMNNRIGCRNDPDNYDAILFCKSRAIDPLCHHEAKIKKLSEAEPEWGPILERESQPKKYFLKFDR